ncbi:hypothetical protein VroAM7_31270 [Vibrio rotiferianus]|uniref:Sel1 repeat family protein n=1 Tax=Vibrio rotiferianus TaxID=190895 RepID=A0A510I9Q7_9VIBR|nr:sel1 repeat family protein [Vibrio rotiferianus]BBL90474.1 hypothetical protein VroAM7_31270 [Vibrio rotiferianus]
MQNLYFLFLVLFVSACSENEKNIAKLSGNSLSNAESVVSTHELYAEANELYEQGRISDAVTKLEVAVERGNEYGRELLGLILLREPSVQNIARGFSLMSDAAQGGLASAQFYLGSCLYDDGCYLPENKTLSAYYLSQAFENGEMGAEMLLGFLDDELGEVKLSPKEFESMLEQYKNNL